MDLSLDMIKEIPSVVSYHYKARNFNYPMIVYLTLVHLAAYLGMFAVSRCSYETLLFAFALWPLSAFGITVGAHRLYSHRSFEAAFPVRLFLMLLSAIANQGSLYHWARDHRVHHKYSETDADPHNASRGFFFAHMGWLLLKKRQAVILASKEIDYSDLMEDSVVRFQEEHDPWFNFYMCFIFPAQVASIFWGEDITTAFLVAGALRYCIVLHFTWTINSVGHMYGDHPYDPLSYPAENPFVSFFIVGEGWHNFHHKYPFDYAASEFGITSQFNPSKLFIDACAACGLVWNRKRALAAWEMGKTRRNREREAGVPEPQRAPRPWEAKRNNTMEKETM